MSPGTEGHQNTNALHGLALSSHGNWDNLLNMGVDGQSEASFKTLSLRAGCGRRCHKVSREGKC